MAGWLECHCASPTQKPILEIKILRDEMITQY